MTRIDLPFAKRTLANGLDVIVHEDHHVPIVAVNVWYHVGSKNERPGRTGFAHLFEHLMFEGSEHHNSRLFPAAPAGGRAAQRIHQYRPDQLLGGRADERGRPGALDGVGSDGLPAARADARALRDPARRRAERAAPELREPAVRPCA